MSSPTLTDSIQSTSSSMFVSPTGLGRSETPTQSFENSESSSSLIEIIRDDEDRIDVVEENLAYRAFDLVCFGIHSPVLLISLA